MKVISFQFQMLTGTLWHPYTILYSIDNRVPKPFLLEEGPERRVLYVAVLDSEKEDSLRNFFQENPTVATLEPSFTTYELDDALYRPDHYVKWEAGTNPTTIG